MNEYDWGDLIINPYGKKVESYIGKEVYYADNPTACLNYANSNDDKTAGILDSIQPEDTHPFYISTRGNYHYSCIIPKKEKPKSEYVPFDTIEEFVKASLIHNKGHYLEGTGIWIEESYDACHEEVYISMVSSFHTYDNTIFVDGNWLALEDVLDSYTFLDDTPCGK